MGCGCDGACWYCCCDDDEEDSGGGAPPSKRLSGYLRGGVGSALCSLLRLLKFSRGVAQRAEPGGAL